MKKVDIPVTNAIRFLCENNIPFVPHFYTYEEHGGTKVAADVLKVPEHVVIKTIVMETELGKPLIVLMHGDFEVSAKILARFIGVKTIVPCDARKAERTTGYVFGGMSPFGTWTRMPVYVEISPKDLHALSPIEVTVAILHQSA
ncbi:MAG: YbaK/EbsC family protein [Bacteroidota bacterium]|nr:YbaK/EbsC family protein [Bacteroidota bacterium]